MTKKKGSQGFTLIEIMIVIGLIAILMAILLPRMARGQTAANDQMAASYLRQIVEAETQYRSRPPFTYTDKLDDLKALEPPLKDPPAGVTAAILSASATDFCAVAKHDGGAYWQQATADGLKPMSVKASEAQPTACE